MGGFNQLFFPIKGTGTPPQTNLQPPTQPTVPNQPVQTNFGEGDPTTGNTNRSSGGIFSPPNVGGIFKFGGEQSFKPIQPIASQQGPRYRVNEAMMRSPYYNPYFSSFQ